MQAICSTLFTSGCEFVAYFYYWINDVHFYLSDAKNKKCMDENLARGAYDIIHSLSSMTQSMDARACVKMFKKGE